MCEDPFKYYGIVSKSDPVCYSISDKGEQELCSSDDTVLSCVDAFNYSAQDLVDVYGRSYPDNYFLHIIAIVIICCVILIFSVLFDNKTMDHAHTFVDDEEGAFYQRDNLNMVRLIIVLEWVLVFLMLWSALEFSLIQVVYCPYSAEIGENSEIGSMCSNLGGCHAGVRSLIEPSNIAARHYAPIVYFLVLVLVVTMLVRLLINRKSARVTDGPSEEELMLQIEAMERADELDRARTSGRLSGRSASEIVDDYDEQLRQHEALFGSTRGPRFGLTGQPRGTGSSRNGFVMFSTHFSADTDPFAQYMNNGDDSSGDGGSDSDGSHMSPEDSLVVEGARGASARVAPAPTTSNRLLQEHVDTMLSRQSLTKRWEYHDIDKVRTNDALRAAVSAQSECAICLCSLMPGGGDTTESPSEDLVVIRVPCSHWFHRNCLMDWIVSAQAASSSSRNTCPICRANLANGKQLKATQDADRIVEFD